VAEDWKELHNEDLHNLYTPPDIARLIKSKRMRWMDHEAHMGEMRNAHKSLVRKPKGKRPLGRPREDEMGRSCGKYGRDEKCIQNFGWKN
jgi:hypothetical protein